MTGRRDPAAAASALAVRLGRLAGRPPATGPQTLQPPGRRETGPGALVRTGPGGCWLGHDGTDPVHVPGFRVDVIDTNGAGDAHAGAFIAALAGGADQAGAARTANAAAAMSVTRRGPATAPTAAELASFLSAR